LEARPADVISFQPRRETPLRGTARGGLSEGLAWWRAAILRQRLLVVTRRALLLALALLVVMLALRAGGLSVAGWLLAALPLLVFVAAFALASLGAGRLALGRVARLLDHGMALAERLGTAWELTPAPGNSLARQVVDDSGQLVWEVGDRFKARARPAPREWAGLAAALVAAVVLFALGAPGGGEGPASLRAGTAGGGASGGAQAAGARRSTQLGTATPPEAARNGATAPLRSGQRGTTAIPRAGTPNAGGSPSTAGTRIAVRQQPASGARSGGAGSTPAGSTHGGTTGGRPGNGQSSNGTASTTGRHGTPTNVPPLPGRAPPSSHVKGFALEGQRATAPLAGGQPTAGSRAAGTPRSGARSGTQGAGQQRAQLGRNGTPDEAAAGSRSLPLRTLSTSGGSERGTGAGRATANGRGRGAARVQRGATGAGSAGGTAPAPLAFVPTDVNVIAPYLRSLVAAYFPQR
jgi:hypothetical protein